MKISAPLEWRLKKSFLDPIKIRNPRAVFGASPLVVVVSHYLQGKPLHRWTCLEKALSPLPARHCRHAICRAEKN
jgi:hypothetical protein